MKSNRLFYERSTPGHSATAAAGMRLLRSRRVKPLLESAYFWCGEASGHVTPRGCACAGHHACSLRYERIHSTRRLIRARFLKAPLSLSPTALCVYTNDIPCPSTGVQLALFAEDPTVYYRAKHKKLTFLYLQRAIDELGQRFRTTRIEVNSAKSAAIQFKYTMRRSRQIVDLDSPHLRLLNTNIPWQFNYTYLGVMLDKDL
ncbi:hypothetical protein EVAR_60583_1 [Eumeta japonica]|uniref:Uncharacterized protein n=1 Tax=Eumeta variegata TaxID=151549 RepID=A0A4C1YGJ2_EUMVA|nr:hypothetical protein EVAR_60583_1 [Eumeta japonica]